MTARIALFILLLGVVAAVPLRAAEPVQAAPATVTRAAYHFDAGLEQARRGLRNIRNHLMADPEARIAVVGLADGIDFMLEGAKTEGGYPFALVIEELQAQGVQFKICNNTLEARQVPRDQIVDGVEIVASGVAELARLQVREGYAYIKP